MASLNLSLGSECSSYEVTRKGSGHSENYMFAVDTNGEVDILIAT